MKWSGFSHASLTLIHVLSPITCSLCLALCIVTLLLCGVTEPNPGTKTTQHDDLGSKIDVLFDDDAK